MGRDSIGWEARVGDSMEIIDAHTNLCFPGERWSDDMSQWPTPGLSLWPTFESRLAVLREAGVTQAVAVRAESVEGISYEALVARNRRIAEACRASGGFLLPCASVQPALGERACALLRYCREELDMRFIGEMLDRWLGYEWGTEEYWQVLQEAARLRMVPLIHCDNERLPELGERCRFGKIMLAHYMRSIEQRVEVMLRYPNLYLLISSSDIARATELTWAIRMLGAERVVFGSDMSATDPVIAVACVQRAKISEQEKQQVFAGTFHAIWEWTEV